MINSIQFRDNSVDMHCMYAASIQEYGDSQWCTGNGAISAEKNGTNVFFFGKKRKTEFERNVFLSNQNLCKAQISTILIAAKAAE